MGANDGALGVSCYCYPQHHSLPLPSPT
jgi:hypothetical protein